MKQWVAMAIKKTLIEILFHIHLHKHLYSHSDAQIYKTNNEITDLCYVFFSKCISHFKRNISFCCSRLSCDFVHEHLLFIDTLSKSGVSRFSQDVIKCEILVPFTEICIYILYQIENT